MILNNCLSREQLTAGQRKDVILSPMFEAASDRGKGETLSVGYVVRDGLLMHKWTPLIASAADDWSAVTLTCPSSISGGHFNPQMIISSPGIKKIYACVLYNFFWPGLKPDVAHYFKSCHNCQVAGSREFKPGDKVLVMLPIPGSSLQARYCRPIWVRRRSGTETIL